MECQCFIGEAESQNTDFWEPVFDEIVMLFPPFFSLGTNSHI